MQFFEHSLEALQRNYKRMKPQFAVPKLSTLTPCVVNNQDLDRVHMEQTFECKMVWKIKFMPHPTKNDRLSLEISGFENIIFIYFGVAVSLNLQWTVHWHIQAQCRHE